MAKLPNTPIFQGLDNDGNPLVGGLLYTYEAGTSTPKTTYTNEGGLTANSNPVVLDSAGRANVWLGDGAYKFILKTSADVTVWTVDNIGGDSQNVFGADYIVQSSNLAITDVHKNSFIECTALLTLTLPPASTAGEGFYFTVKNSGSANVTIDPNASELIDGASTKVIAPNSSCLVICSGTKWETSFESISDGDKGDIVVSSDGQTWTIDTGAVTRAKLATGAVAPVNITGSKTANYTATTDDDFIPCDATSAGFTVTLYAASGNAGREITIKKTDSSFNVVTIDANASETIDGATTRRLCTQNEKLTLVCDGSNWYIKDRDIPSIWTTYTTTVTHDSGGITNNTNTTRYRRIGDSIEVMHATTFSAASAAFTGFYLSVPSGLTVDSAKMPATTNFAVTVGTCQTLDAGVQSYQGQAFYVSTGVIVLFVQGSAGTYANGQIISNTIPFTFNSGDFITARFVVPITNWEG